MTLLDTLLLLLLSTLHPLLRALHPTQCPLEYRCKHPLLTRPTGIRRSIALGVLTLPTTLGTSGQVLNTTDGSGTLAWTTPVSGSVTSVAALTLGTTGTDLTSSVATDTSTPVITLNVPTASASNRGALSAADWSTFNGKQAALTSGTNLKTVGGNSLLGSGDAGAIGIGYGGTGLTTVGTSGTVLTSDGSAACRQLGA